MIAKLRCAGSVLGIYFSAQRHILKGIFAAFMLCVSSASNLCSGALIPAFAPPDGGWTYIYSGNAISNSLGAALDGSWNHLNGSDAWSGDGRGTGVGLA